MALSGACQARLTLFPSCTELLTRLVDEGNSIGIIYLDFSTALDKVSYVILVNKVKKYGPDDSTVG